MATSILVDLLPLRPGSFDSPDEIVKAHCNRWTHRHVPVYPGLRIIPGDQLGSQVGLLNLPHHRLIVRPSPLDRKREEWQGFDRSRAGQAVLRTWLERRPVYH